MGWDSLSDLFNQKRDWIRLCAFEVDLSTEPETQSHLGRMLLLLLLLAIGAINLLEHLIKESSQPPSSIKRTR